MRNFNWKMDDNFYLVMPRVEDIYRTQCESSFDLHVTRNFLGFSMIECGK